MSGKNPEYIHGDNQDWFSPFVSEQEDNFNELPKGIEDEYKASAYKPKVCTCGVDSYYKQAMDFEFHSDWCDLVRNDNTK